MKTFANLLRYYNNIDVVPSIETLETIRGLYTKLGIDIFQGRGIVARGFVEISPAGHAEQARNPPELYAPGLGAYEMLKGAVVWGPGLVFRRKNEAGKTTIRSHKYQDAKVCQKVFGYDANTLHPSTMLGAMPFRKEVVVHWPQTPGQVERFVEALQRNRWFGFTEVDIEVPMELWPKLEEMPPLF